VSGCPWSDWPQTAADFCERSLCAWVRQPGNTWSNVGFLLAGLWMLYDSRRLSRRHLSPIARITLFLAFGSAFFHASETTVGQLADWAGMMLAGAWMLTVCVERITLWRRPAVTAVFWLLFALPMSTFLLDRQNLRWVFSAEGTICAGLELWLSFGPRRAGSYLWNLACWAALVPAMVAWGLDTSGKLCHPDNHWISGHALWHLLAALGFVFAYLYYAQFPAVQLGPVGRG